MTTEGAGGTRPELPPPETATLELEVGEAELAELRRRAIDEDVAPADDEHLVRYLVYLGAAYLRLERLHAETPDDPLGDVRRLCDATRSAGATLRFHYGEAVRAASADARAIVAEEHFIASFSPAVDAMADEVERRRERLRALEEALDAR